MELKACNHGDAGASLHIWPEFRIVNLHTRFQSGLKFLRPSGALNEDVDVVTLIQAKEIADCLGHRKMTVSVTLRLRFKFHANFKYAAIPFLSERILVHVTLQLGADSYETRGQPSGPNLNVDTGSTAEDGLRVPLEEFATRLRFTLRLPYRETCPARDGVSFGACPSASG